MENGEVPKAISPSETDCLKWAVSFVEHVKWKPEIATDEGAMMAWFASAICAGFDDAQRRRDKEVREFIGWLCADISELHSVEVPRLADSYKLFLNTRDPDSKEAREYAASVKGR